MSRHEEGPPTAGIDEVRPTTPVMALRNRESGEEVVLPDGDISMVIGKSATCDLVVADATVSRAHCVLERRRGVLFVRDTRSRNGTYVNDRRVECAELSPGAELLVGGTRFLALGPRRGSQGEGFARLLGRDPQFMAAIEQARRVALTEVSVLIVGETGTGKELVAQAIHEASPRFRHRFLAVNCGAFPRELIGSELFGHERGAFTGAIADHDGVFVQADRGTLFLDEIGELPLSQQPHLLRALETRRVRRVGGSAEHAFDTRVVAATNRTAGLGTERGSLRLDLYHRVATVLIELPPLRARQGDIDLLVDEVLTDLAATHGRRVLSHTSRRLLQSYRWPGNVRELRQTLTRGAALSQDVIEPHHLFQPALRKPTPVEQPVLARGSLVRPPDGSSQDAEPRTRALVRGPRSPGAEDSPPLPRMAMVERDLFADALERHGTLRAAAEAVGIPKSTFADRAHKLGLVVPGRHQRDGQGDGK